jgi:hypothetical protein
MTANDALDKRRVRDQAEREVLRQRAFERPLLDGLVQPPHGGAARERA